MKVSNEAALDAYRRAYTEAADRCILLSAAVTERDQMIEQLQQQLPQTPQPLPTDTVPWVPAEGEHVNRPQ